MKKKIKALFLTGLAVTVPIGLTLYILIFLIGVMDGLLTIIPDRYHPDTLLAFHIPGLGVIVTLLLIFVCGLVTRSYFGNRMVAVGEGLLNKIPFVRSIYQAIKQISDSMFRDMSGSFKKVVLLEFPRRGMYCVAFVTGTVNGEFQRKTGKSLINVFIPTAPNPTSGYFLMVAEEEMISLEITVEQAFTLIISGGIVTPPGRDGFETVAAPAAPAGSAL